MKFFDKLSLYYLEIPSESLNLYASFAPNKMDSTLSKAYKALYLGYLLYRDFSYVHNEIHKIDYEFWFPLLNKFCLEREQRYDNRYGKMIRWRFGNNTITARDRWMTSTIENDNIGKVIEKYLPKKLRVSCYQERWFMDEDFVSSKYCEVGIKLMDGINYLLVGRPGNGKTTLAKNFVKNKRSIFVERVDNIYLLKNVINVLNTEVLVIDDCDRISGNERDFLSVIDFARNKNISVIFLANSFTGILADKAITRSGRIDSVIEVGDPDLDGIKDLLRLYLGNEEGAEKLLGKSRAEIELYCRRRGLMEDDKIEELRKKYANRE